MASSPADNDSDCSTGDLKSPSIDLTRQFPTFELLDNYLRQYAADSNIVLSQFIFKQRICTSTQCNT
eukprot:scaffold251481_cov142-Cyclotella_meneghiniana.AAC.1